MALTMAHTVYCFLFYVLAIAGKLGSGICSGNTTIGNDGIGINSLLCAEHGSTSIHMNNKRLDTTTNECIATSLSSSSANETIATETLLGEVNGAQTETTSTTTPTPSVDTAAYMNIGFGEIQAIHYDPVATQKRLIETLLYMYNNTDTVTTTDSDVLGVVNNDTTTTVPNVECKMHNELCAYWAARGECELRPGYMRIKCAPTCFSCHDIIFEQRCPAPDMSIVSKTNAWNPGDLNRMFERIVNNSSIAEIPGRMQSVTVLSRPSVEIDGVSAPWVVQIDNFLTSEECTTLIQLGSEQGYLRSTGLNFTKDADGTFGSVVEDVRTSTNAWCFEQCHDHPTTQRILQRIEEITNVPDINSEYLQLLHYDVGQFYKVHHDYIDFHLARAQGVRLATVFLYLNDVEEGGGTNFPLLNLTVQPKRGRAVIWPSVLDRDPDTIDRLTEHQALPVVTGVKYGANSWIHQRDFKTPYKIHCTG